MAATAATSFLIAADILSILIFDISFVIKKEISLAYKYFLCPN